MTDAEAPKIEGLLETSLYAHNRGRTAAFYRDLFGWQFGDAAMPDMDYRMFQLSDEMGVASYPSDDAGSGYLVYIDTDDIDASADRRKSSAKLELSIGFAWMFVKR